MFQRIISFIVSLAFGFSVGSTPPQRCEAKFNGTFLQSWLCLWWSDEDWQEEIRYMKEAGIEYLILQDVASFSGGSAEVNYPSGLECFAGCEPVCDVVDAALRNCQNSGLKVFVGLADYADWWVWGGIRPAYQTVCETMAQMMTELYDNYHESYRDTFYGWYFTPEFNNVLTHQVSWSRIIRDFNTVIDRANELDPSLPMLVSPYFTEYLSVPSVLATYPMWKTFFQKAHLRDGDIFAPQDAVGAQWTPLDRLEDVWKMYAAAVKTCPGKVALWANCENMTVARKALPFMPPATLEQTNQTATLDRFVRQMEIASHYAENIITFSYNHFYSPHTVHPTYHDTYLDYLQNGRLETEPPAAPGDLTVSDGVLTWSASTDNIGIAYYIVYQNGKAVARVEADEDLQINVKSGKTYTVVALDGAGNRSESATVTA